MSFVKRCKFRANWNYRLNTPRIQWEKDSIISIHNRLKITSCSNPRHLIDIQHVAIEIGVLGQLFLATFEKDVVDRVKSKQSSKQPNICKC